MMFSRATLVAATLLVGLSPLAAQDAAQANRRPTLTVSGEGSATAAPDVASFASGVVTEGKTAREALDANTRAVADMVAAIKSSGVESRDVSTSGFSVQPQYATQKKDEAPRIAGYQVRNTVSVRVRDLTKLGDLLDKMVTTGANQVGSISFDIAKPAALQEAARVNAVKDARRQAEIMADAAGVRLVRILTIIGEPGAQPMPRMMTASAMMKSDAVPVEAGEAEIHSNVSVTYEIEAR